MGRVYEGGNAIQWRGLMEFDLISLTNGVAYVEVGTMEDIRSLIPLGAIIHLKSHGLFRVIKEPGRSMQLMYPPIPTSRWFIPVEPVGEN